jgi:16S rRNA (guanine527-N7)-methyltransferase
MDEAAAKSSLDVPRETLERLEAFARFVREENERQNLVSAASLEHLWARHILDSAQLVRFVPPEAPSWLDLGTGAGFPGLIVAFLHAARVTMVEERKLRVDFLARAAALLGVAGKSEILGARIEAVPGRPFAAISARAFAPLDKLLRLGSRFATDETIWVLPKGRNAKSELDAALSSWQGDFRLEASLTDADAGIIVARGVRPRRKGKSAR